MKKLLLFTAIVLASNYSMKAQAFLQEFDDSTQAKTQGWIWSNLSNVIDPAAMTWYLSSAGTSPVVPYSGSDCFQTSYESCISINPTDTVNTWLMSPVRLLKNGDKIIFNTTKEGGSTAYPDNMQVRLSISGSATVTGTHAYSYHPFDTLLLDINPTLSGTGYPTSWTVFSITLSNLPAAGVNGRFAFRYYIPDLDANCTYVDVDSVAYVPYTPTGIKGSSLDNAYRISPNPTNGPLKITFPGSSPDREVIVQNMLGQAVFRATLNSMENNIDLSSLEKGQYLVNIREGNRYSTEKISIQ